MSKAAEVDEALVSYVNDVQLQMCDKVYVTLKPSHNYFPSNTSHGYPTPEEVTYISSKGLSVVLHQRKYGDDIFHIAREHMEHHINRHRYHSILVIVTEEQARAQAILERCKHHGLRDGQMWRWIVQGLRVSCPKQKNFCMLMTVFEEHNEKLLHFIRSFPHDQIEEVALDEDVKECSTRYYFECKLYK